ncbi:hypothetical protein EJ05DRAFT_500416 [Pseudovirgaria hyperparasitica]|uniref:Uncharacterized protein n=1 Tax=Pseudovirgaria hyperparasitica TaxID=470096 RepID=A0A6A6W9W9_9PEZI|nr:uncharacterized protein EJ05DRAFT_500416 [Pseudovirgaria hyperparasitica]KAF2757891.1 hypothetical protein EJ05DRAFT_500416 [Pseudovirgaria hyperparasitica]
MTRLAREGISLWNIPDHLKASFTVIFYGYDSEARNKASEVLGLVGDLTEASWTTADIRIFCDDNHWEMLPDDQLTPDQVPEDHSPGEPVAFDPINDVYLNEKPCAESNIVYRISRRPQRSPELPMQLTITWCGEFWPTSRFFTLKDPPQDVTFRHTQMDAIRYACLTPLFVAILLDAVYPDVFYCILALLEKTGYKLIQEPQFIGAGWVLRADE